MCFEHTRTVMTATLSFSALSTETLARICSLLGCTDDSAARATLLSVALTCRFSNGPALDALWRSLPSVIPLFFALPTDLCALTPSEGSSRRIMNINFLRQPTPADFIRFSHYARRVKYLDTTDAPRLKLRYNIDWYAWGILPQYAPTPLLPNLRTLTYDELHDRAFLEPSVLPVDALLGPKLQVVDLQVAVTSDPDVWILPDALKEHAPNVVELRLTFGVGSSQGCLTGRSLGELNSLTTLIAQDVDLSPDLLSSLGCLPALQTLKFDQVPCDWYSGDRELVQSGRQLGNFPALQVLSFAGDLESVRWVLETLPSSSLRDIDVTVFTDGGQLHDIDEPPCDLFNTLRDHPSALSIQVLSVAFVHPETNGSRPAVTPYSPDSFQAILSLRNLRELRVGDRCRFLVDGFFLEEMSKCLPHITVLDLCWAKDWSESTSARRHRERERGNVGRRARPYRVADVVPGRPDAPWVGLHSLIDISLRCPELVELEVAVDARFIPVLDDELLSGRDAEHAPGTEAEHAGSRLRQLGMRGSIVEDPRSVAEFLYKLFPNLESIDVDQRNPCGDLVQAYYEAFAAGEVPEDVLVDEETEAEVEEMEMEEDDA
ncbi:hypothetical protein BD413DRAFT_142202 [Trametes elegans]|nr:hypothetical protein BD413DRAFT_142202 [Trametes elegans]